MKALLLAAGLGTRLRPLTLHTPKCLVPIHGRPLLDYWLEMLVSGGVTQILINLHYLHDSVLDYLEKSSFSGQVHTVYEKKLLGTGGTLLRNRAFFQDQPVLLVHADNYSVFEMKAFILAHQSRPAHCDITMMTFVTDTPESCGIVELDANGVVQAFYEKSEQPPGNLANGAVYILEPSVIEFLESLKTPEIDFSTQVLPEYVGRIFTFHNCGYHRDIGTPESYQKALEQKI